MANFFLLNPALSDAGTITGYGTIAAAMPAGDLLSLAPGTRCRWTATAGAYLVLDLGAAASWDTVALLAHTAGASDAFRIRAATSEANLTAAPAIDQAGISFWPAAGKPTRTDAFHSFWRWPAVVTYRWLRLDFTLAAAPFEIQRLMAAAAFQPARNYSYGSGDGFVATGTKSRSIGGHTWPAPGRPLKAKTLLLEALTEAELFESVNELLRTRSAEKDCFIVLDPDADAHRVDQMLWGTLDDPGLAPIRFHDRWQKSLAFTEQAP